VVTTAEAYDPAGSMFGFGVLLGAASILVVAAVVAISALMGVSNTLTNDLAELSREMPTGIGTYAGMVIASLILGIIGLFIGRKFA
ncbi:MAG: hypothetical protein R3336_02455, partial [Phycisphaeraceae bacterium]|nr:hypothetical protein [Phycisphaeraceae bacterium]